MIYRHITKYTINGNTKNINKDILYYIGINNYNITYIGIIIYRLIIRYALY